MNELKTGEGLDKISSLERLFWPHSGKKKKLVRGKIGVRKIYEVAVAVVQGRGDSGLV